MKKEANKAARAVIDHIIACSEEIKAKYGHVLYAKQKTGGSKGGRAKWANMTPEERTDHITKMNKAKKKS